MTISSYGFAVDWMRKDLGICHGYRQRETGASLPVNAHWSISFYKDVQKLGGGQVGYVLAVQTAAGIGLSRRGLSAPHRARARFPPKVFLAR